MSTKKMLNVRLEAAVIELLKKLASDRGESQAAVIRALILREVYK